MANQLFHIDAFTDKPFGGNPAAVCLLEDERDTDWMHCLAREMNLPATAIVRREGEAFRLRWFTITNELVLCGHGTLAAAHGVLEAEWAPPTSRLEFHTQSGQLTARRDAGWIELDFRADPPSAVDAPAILLEALGVDASFVGRSSLDHLVEVESEAAVQDLQPNLDLLRQVETRGVMVTAPAQDSGYDFVSRFFAPSTGIDEDPVTGSAHACLGPFWRERLGRHELVAHQLSARGGQLRVRPRGERVGIAGQAITLFRSPLSL